jgi:hypothetical protein
LAFFSGCGTADGLEGEVGFGEERASAVAEEFAGGGEAGGAGGAFEEVAVETGFEKLNVAGERGLGEVKAEGGPAEVELLGDGDEVSKVAELDPIQIHTFKISINVIDSI